MSRTLQIQPAKYKAMGDSDLQQQKRDTTFLTVETIYILDAVRKGGSWLAFIKAVIFKLLIINLLHLPMIHSAESWPGMC
jgi:hypothetical protein